MVPLHLRLFLRQIRHESVCDLTSPTGLGVTLLVPSFVCSLSSLPCNRVGSVAFDESFGVCMLLHSCYAYKSYTYRASCGILIWVESDREQGMI